MNAKTQAGEKLSRTAISRQPRKPVAPALPHPADSCASAPVMRAWPMVELGSEIYAAETLIEALAEKLIEQYAKSPTAESVRLSGGIAEIVTESRSRLHTALFRTFHYYLGGARA